MWTLRNCSDKFECWCRIIIDPNGEECNPYAEIHENAAQLIVDALNNKTECKNNKSEDYPFPWRVVKNDRDQKHKYIVPANFNEKDDKDNTDVGHCWGNEEKFVEAVNRFYVY